MKLVRYGANRLGLLAGVNGQQLVVDVHGSLKAGAGSDVRELLEDDPGADWTALIENWNRARDTLTEILERASAAPDQVSSHPRDAVVLKPPIPSPHSRIFALGGNFGSHVADAAKKKQSGLPPWGFTVLHGTIVGPDAEVRPPAFVNYLDAEAEVAAIFGPRVTPGADAPPVWGYTAWNDVSIRDGILGKGDVDHGPGYKWAMAKNFETANVCGPCVCVDEVSDVRAMRIIGRVNGEVRQDATLAGMVFSFADTASFISTYLPLSSGDIVLSGTPGGTAVESGLAGRYLEHGDVMEVEVSSVGLLRNRVARS